MLTTPFTHYSSLLSAACQITTSLVEGGGNPSYETYAQSSSLIAHR